MNRFVISPWSNDFLDDLLGLVLELAQSEPAGDMGNILIVFPHRRPGRHFLDRLARSARVEKPCVPPETTAMDELAARLAPAVRGGAPRTMIPPLDRIGILRQCLDAVLEQEKRFPLSGFMTSDPARFFPWGARLADLMEELFRHGVKPGDIAHVEGQVEDYAARLLARLGRIASQYLDRLEREKLTTPGLDALEIARNPDKAGAALAGRKIIIAGFHGLTGMEEALFRTLWREGKAMVLLQGDPALARPGQAPHWSCGELAAQIRRWGAAQSRIELLERKERPAPEIIHYQGFDLHSQLAALSRELAREVGPESSMAVVAPDPSMLMPVLHHLPLKEVNISLGYPLERSALFRLVESLMAARENSPSPGRYHWRDIIEIIRHPYLKMLRAGESSPLRLLFHLMEDELRQGDKYGSPLECGPWRRAPEKDMAEVLDGADPDQALALLDQVLDLCFARVAGIETLAGLAGLLDELCALLIERGGDLWARFPLDAECIHRLRANLIPALRHCRIAADPYPHQVLFAILREMVRTERVPFEAEPLTGIQVLGMLETRLLRFDRVLVLGATEGNLPGPPPRDPLLPDPLRHILGLPDGRMRDKVSAYNFFRLLAGAREAVLIHQIGVDGGLMDEKPVRSRFVEELIWQEEQRSGKILQPGQEPVRLVSFPVRPIPAARRAVVRTPGLERMVLEMLDKPLPVSRLDQYFKCPAAFFHRYLAGLAPPPEALEEPDQSEIGQLVHDVLKEFFTPWLHKPLGGISGYSGELGDLFAARLAKCEFSSRGGADQRILLEMAGRKRLGLLLENTPEGTIRAVEKEYERTASDRPGARRIQGRLDRVDEREFEDGPGLMVLDYKTGSVRVPPAAIWRDEALWAGVLDPPEELEKREELLAELSRRMGSIQLPAYLRLVSGGSSPQARGAALIELKKNGEEKHLFGKKMDSRDRDRAVQEQIPALLDFVLSCLEKNPRFAPQPGQACKWCPYIGPCLSG